MDTQKLYNPTFKLLEKVGEGTYGTVYRAEILENGKIVAIKKIRLGNEGFPSSSLREIAILKKLQHPNIVMLEDVMFRKERLYIVLEYMDFNLDNYLKTVTVLEPPVIKSYLMQLLTAISYCHSHGVLHRDLKPPNILLDKHGTLKLADFGLARSFITPFRRYSREAPEVLLGQEVYACPVDMWAIGCIFAEMIMRKILFRGDSEIDQLFRIFKLLGTPTEEMWEGVIKLPEYRDTFPKWSPTNLQTLKSSDIDSEAFDLLSQCLIYDPRKRISAKQALKHNYFNQ